MLTIIAIGFLISFIIVARDNIGSDEEVQDNEITRLISPTPNLSRIYGAIPEGSQEYLEQRDREPKVVTYCMIDGRLIDR